MNCFEFEESVGALARNQLMDALVYVRGMAHAESCARCGGRLAAERVLLSGISEVISEVTRQKAPARVEAAVLAAFREEVQAARPRAFVPARPKVNWFRWKLVAAAACIMTAASVMAIVWLKANSRPSQTPAETATGLTSSRPEKLPVPVPPEATQPPRENDLVSAAPRKSRAGATRVKRQAAEVVTEFYPIVDGVGLDSVEGGQILRVELPASALTDAGLPTGPEGPNGSVKADVVLGHDGMARAIRFVR